MTDGSTRLRIRQVVLLKSHIKSVLAWDSMLRFERAMARQDLPAERVRTDGTFGFSLRFSSSAVRLTFFFSTWGFNISAFGHLWIS